ncbi:MAG: hypothetical protein COB14_07550 [Alphaproteobacteria bacterium]|nr:MAG: hypothetical protein COB14_07550 [Alphaproteobacteria bacterium]
MSLNHKQDITAQNHDKKLRQTHQKGFMIAKNHITPFLRELEAKHKFTKKEVAAALIILAYSALRRSSKSPFKDTLTTFGVFSNMSIDLIENHKKQKTLH